MYADEETHECVDCHSTCNTCDAPGDSNCGDCVAPRFFYIDEVDHMIKKCVEECPFG